VTADSPASNHSSEAFESEHIAIAAIGRPVGLDGWCRLFPFGNTLGNVLIPFSLEAGVDTPQISVELIELNKDAKGFKGLFKGYTEREAVDTLKNYQLFINRDQMPGKQPDEYYHFELEGLAVCNNKTEERIGTVIKVHNYPTMDALEVQKESGYTYIVPMTKEVITQIDSDTGTIFINASVIDELL
jgi:16S rRNA processing protein RimM